MTIPADRLRRATAAPPSQQAARFIQSSRAEQVGGAARGSSGRGDAGRGAGDDGGRDDGDWETADWARARRKNDDWALPSYFTQPRLIIAGVIVGALVLGEVQARYRDWASVAANDKMLAENCLHITTRPGSEPPERWAQDDYHNYPGNRIRDRNGLLAAMEQCSPNACSPRDFESYVAGLSGYLGGRIHAYNKAHADHGKPGIKVANEFFRTNDDYSIIDTARDWLKAGRLQRSHLSPERFRYLELLIAHSRDKVPMCYTGGDKAGSGKPRASGPNDFNRPIKMGPWPFEMKYDD